MINKYEIMTLATKYNLPANTIEKDYILSWILAGINASLTLKQSWVFKGGTCLKKCYFGEYRFSEDLDFTIIDPAHVNQAFLNDTFPLICEWIYDQSGITIPADKLKFEEYKNPRNKLSIQGKIPFQGPMQRKSNLPTIKLDLSHDEILIEKPTIKLIHHPYTDYDESLFMTQTYCIEEIFAEKLRALVERMRPRDLYDVIHLHNDSRIIPNKEKLLSILKQKCHFKQIASPTIELLQSMSQQNELRADWNDMLTHQIANLESFEYYWEQLPAVFEWLYN